MTVVAAFGTSLLHFLVISAENKYGDWARLLRCRGHRLCPGPSPGPSGCPHRRAGKPGVCHPGGGPKPRKAVSLSRRGLPAASWDTLPIRLLSGRLPENDGEVLVPSHLAVKGGVSLSVGDTLTLSVGSRQAGGISLSQADPYRPGEETLVSTTEKTYTVVGTLRTAHPWNPTTPRDTPCSQQRPPRASYLPPSVRHPVSPPPGAGLRRPHRVQRPGFVQ